MSFSSSLSLDFNTFTAAGFQPVPAAGQLSSNQWRVQGFSDNAGLLNYGDAGAAGTDYGRGLYGSQTTAGVYYANTGIAALGAASLIVKPTAAEFGATPGSITLRLQYTGSTALTGFNFDYDAVFRNSQGRDSFENFSYAVQSAATQPTSFSANVAALSFVTPTTADALGWKTTDLATQAFTVPVNTNDYIFLRFSIGDNGGGSGSRDEIGFDNINISGITAAPAATLSISPATLSLNEGDAGVTPFAFSVTRSDATPGDATVSVTLGTAAGSGFDAADFSSITVGGVTVAGAAIGTPFQVTLTAGQTSVPVLVNVSGDTALEADEAFTLTLSGASTGYSLATAVANATILNDDTAVTAISAIQGTGAASPLVNQTVTIQGVVTGDYQNGDADAGRNLQGFFVQSLVGDGDARTSEGIFVLQADNILGTDVHVGDIVRVSGTVLEAFTQTELSVANSTTGISIVTPGAYTPSQVISQFALDVNFPTVGTVTAGGRVIPDLEFAEGMLIRIPQTVTITEAFNVDRFGEARVAVGGQATQYTQTNAPSVSGYQAYLNDLGSRSLLIDDGLNVQNPSPITFLGNTVTTATAPQIGDSFSGLVGNLGYDFNEYRLQASNSPAIIDTQPRLGAPGRADGDVKIVGTNLLNYFTTIDTGPGATTGPGNAFEPRGANDAGELARQTQKLYTALTALDGDLIIVNELENNGFGPGSAIRSLVDGFNASLGAPGRWTFVDPGVTYLGGDAIKVSMLYRTDRLALATGSTVEVLDDNDIPGLISQNLLPANFLSQSTVGHVFNGVNTSRAILVASFQEIGTGEVFTAAAVHNKSKSGIGTGSDADQLDGAGNWNNQRALATQALDAFLQTHPTGSADPDTIILGDFNSYAQERSVRYLTDTAGLHNLISDGIGNGNAASYVFDGQKGYLDYAFSSAALAPYVRSVDEWRVNSPEFDAIDYNTDFGRPTGVFDGTVANRYSDHDPVVVNLLLSPAVTLSAGGARTAVFNSFAPALTAASANTVIDVVKPGQIGDVGSQTVRAEGLTIQGQQGFLGQFNLAGGVVAATLGGAAGLSLTGNALNNVLTGNEGDNTLEGGAGADTLIGGAGFDSASYANATSGLTVRLDFANLDTGEATGDVLTGIERLVGSGFDDTLVGTAANEVLVGNGGNDILIGRQGADIYYGGAGQDFFAFAFEDFQPGVYDVIKDANVGGVKDWFVTNGVARDSILAADYQGGVAVTIASVGFGLSGGGFYIENFALSDFWSQLYTI